MMLGPADTAVIEAAIADAEARTAGEIYCIVTPESGAYGETPLAWAAGVALLGPALLLLGAGHLRVPELFGSWSAAQAGEAAERAARQALMGAVVVQAALFVATLAIVAIAPVRRALTPRAFKRERVRRRALEQFAAKSLHLTRERTGVLIFVSFAERMAELIADEGVASHVAPHVWDRAMAAAVAGLRQGRAGEGVAQAVALCGEVLAEHFPASPGDNPDQLPNTVVVLPRP